MKHLDEEHISIVNSELGTDKEGKGLELWELFKKKYAGSEAHHQMLALGEFIEIQIEEDGQSGHGWPPTTTYQANREVLQHPRPTLAKPKALIYRLLP